MNLAPVLLAVALVAQDGAPASPPPSDEVRARVRALLLPIDRPVSPGAIRAIGPGAEEALAEIALSRDFSARRARALEVLAALRSVRAEEVHRAASAAGEPRSVRRAAVRGLAVLVPASRVAAELRPFVERDRDPGIRAAAAEALASAAPADGCAAVRAQAAKEGGDGQARFRRALRSCSRARR
jgi:hypothetical protein